MFKLARLIDKKDKDLNQVRCIKDDSHQVLIGDRERRDREAILITCSIRTNNILDLHAFLHDRNLSYICRTRPTGVNDAMRNLRT